MGHAIHMTAIMGLALPLPLAAPAQMDLEHGVARTVPNVSFSVARTVNYTKVSASVCAILRGLALNVISVLYVRTIVESMVLLTMITVSANVMQDGVALGAISARVSASEVGS